MTVFICHSAPDASAARGLVADLLRAGESVWIDTELRGGDQWWSTVLDAIRDCTVFVVALSANTLRSKTSRAEIRYAIALQLPILPVQIGAVGSYRIDPIFRLHWVDYRRRDPETGEALIAALRQRATERVELPQPLPQPPPLPHEYLNRWRAAIDTGEPMASTTQAGMFLELRSELADEDDASVRAAVAQLLGALRDRPETPHRLRAEIDKVLRAEAAWTQTRFGRRWRRRRTLVLIATALIVVAAIGTTSFVLLEPSPSPPRSAAPGPVPVSSLQALLLSAKDMETALSAGHMQVDDSFNQMSDDSADLPDADCLAFVIGAEGPVYAGSNWIATRGQFVSESRAAGHRVDQAVVLFPRALDAAAFFSHSAQQWPRCSNREFTQLKNGVPAAAWRVGPVSHTDGVLSATRTRTSGESLSCQRALTVRNNVAVDILDCSADPGNAAVDIAGRIAAKIPPD